MHSLACWINQTRLHTHVGSWFSLINIHTHSKKRSRRTQKNTITINTTSQKTPAIHQVDQVSGILLYFKHLHITALITIILCLKITTSAAPRPSHHSTISSTPSLSPCRHHVLYPTIAPTHLSYPSLHQVITSCILPCYNLPLYPRLSHHGALWTVQLMMPS